jgi:hypothetical protein
VYPFFWFKQIYHTLIKRFKTIFCVLQEPNKIDGWLKRLPLTFQCLDTGGLYLLDDGFTFLVWLGRMLPPELVNNILGVSLANFPDLSKVQRFHFIIILLATDFYIFS